MQEKLENVHFSNHRLKNSFAPDFYLYFWKVKNLTFLDAVFLLITACTYSDKGLCRL